MSKEADNIILKALKRKEQLQLNRCFDPWVLESVPTEKQQTFFDSIHTHKYRFVLGGNQSGKSTCCGREGSWMFMENHPSWSRPNSKFCNRCKSESIVCINTGTKEYQCRNCSNLFFDWGKLPLTLIVVGQVGEQVRELWTKKIKPYLQPEDYKEIIVGNVLSRVVNNHNGNEILLMTHFHDDVARKKAQSYVAHWVWVDEMPASIKLMEELQRRVQTMGGSFVASFTPKVTNNEIKTYVDMPADNKFVIRLPMLENPRFKNSQQAQLDALVGYPDAYKATILNGDWWPGDHAVYQFFSKIHCEEPVGYSPTWRHLESVDPASSSIAGYLQIAENPITGVWYVVKSEYIPGNTAVILLEEFQKRARGINIVKRVCDPQSHWFIKEAANQEVFYTTPFNKAHRKDELIKKVQEDLDSGKIKIKPDQKLLIDEFTSYQWSAAVPGKIMASQKYHLLHALQYVRDKLPDPDSKVVERTPTQAVFEEFKARQLRIHSLRRFRHGRIS